MRKHLTLVLALIVLALPLASCEKENIGDDVVTGLVINEQEYPTVKIGEQTWSAVNYRGPNGVNTTDNAKLGKLYTIAEAKAITLPAGWRLPTKGDYEKLITHYGAKMEPNGGDPLLMGDATVAFKLMSSENWWLTQGNNASGFNAYPVAYFGSKNSTAMFWTSSISSSGQYFFLIDQWDENGHETTGSWVDFGTNAETKMCIRFVKDN